MHQEILSISSDEQNVAEMAGTARGRSWCCYAYSGGARNRLCSSRHYLKGCLSSLSGGGFFSLIGGRLKLARTLGLVLLSTSGGGLVAKHKGIILVQFFSSLLAG